MGTTRREERGQQSGLRVCEGRAIVLQRFKLKPKKGKEKEKKNSTWFGGTSEKSGGDD